MAAFVSLVIVWGLFFGILFGVFFEEFFLHVAGYEFVAREFHRKR